MPICAVILSVIIIITVSLRRELKLGPVKEIRPEVTWLMRCE